MTQSNYTHNLQSLVLHKIYTQNLGSEQLGGGTEAKFPEFSLSFPVLDYKVPAHLPSHHVMVPEVVKQTWSIFGKNSNTNTH